MKITNHVDAIYQDWKKTALLESRDYLEGGENIIREAMQRLDLDLDRYELTMRRGIATGQRRERVRST